MADVVLVVVTDPGVAQAIERAFRPLGVDTVIADAAEAALVALEFEKPLAAIVENDLPDRSGLDLVVDMRKMQEGESIPILLLAGPMMPAEELAPRALEKGVTACLDASVDRTKMAEAMNSLLAGDPTPMQSLVNGEQGGGPPDTSVAEFDAGAEQSAKPKTVEGVVKPNASASKAPDVKTPPPRAIPSTPPAEPRSGQLGALPFGRLLAELHHDLATGILELTREKVKKSIWLRDGVPVFAKSNAMGETLGAVLVKMGRITDAQRTESMESAQKQKRKHGDVLVEMGLIKPKDVGTALQAQARAKVINCFAWDDGMYSFKPTYELPDDLPELKMTFGALIAAGVKQRYDLPRLRKVLLPHIGETARFQDQRAPILDQMKADDDERTVLEALKGKRSVAEVLALSDMDETHLHRILVTGWFAGILEFKPEGPTTARIRLEREQMEQAAAEEKTTKPEKTNEETNEATNEDGGIVVDVDVELGLGSFGDDDGEKTNKQDDVGDDETETGTGRGKGAKNLSEKREKREVTTERTGEKTAPPSVDPAIEARVDAALSRMKDQTHYERLAVPHDANDSAIKASYLKLAKDFHPDRVVTDGGSGLKAKADSLFSMISDAYSTLMDAGKRRAYDDKLSGKSDDASEEANAILSAENAFLKGERLLKAGNIAKAFESFQTAVELYPKESEYQTFYGWTLWKMNHPGDKKKMAEGEKIIRDALKANARNDKAHFYLGQIAKLGDEDLATARKEFEKALEIQPENADAQRELRLLEMRDGKKGITGLFRSKK